MYILQHWQFFCLPPNIKCDVCTVPSTAVIPYLWNVLAGATDCRCLISLVLFVVVHLNLAAILRPPNFPAVCPQQDCSWRFSGLTLRSLVSPCCWRCAETVQMDDKSLAGHFEELTAGAESLDIDTVSLLSTPSHPIPSHVHPILEHGLRAVIDCTCMLNPGC